MARRVSDTDVKKIIDTDLDDIIPFIDVANITVTNVVGGENLGASVLKELERWLSAHFIAVRDPVALKEKVDDAETTHALAISNTIEGLGLNSTPYGQQVILIDPSGKFATAKLRAPVFKAY